MNSVPWSLHDLIILPLLILLNWKLGLQNVSPKGTLQTQAIASILPAFSLAMKLAA